MDIELFESEMSKRLSARRMKHTLGCADTAVRLAARVGEDTSLARAAGLLHDMTKEWSIPDQLKFCEKHGIIISDTQKKVPEILHAITGAYAARLEFGVPKEVAGAIRWHSTGKPGMTGLEKIVWLADLIEPGRDFPGVEFIRDMAQKDIDRAILMGMERTIKYLLDKKQIIDPVMLEARNTLISGEQD